MVDYTYDCRNRLTGTGKKLSSKTYTYGAGLISEHGNGQNSSQDSTRNGVQGSGQGSARDDTETLYYHYNHLGSTTAVTDKTGSIRYRFAYGTYGELAAVMDGTGATLIRAQTGKTVQECLNEAVAETGIRFLYNGKYGVTTEQNGLYYMRARYYNTDIKPFINRDVVDGSIENGQSLNKYSYVQGNPVNLTDPFGLSPVGGDDDDIGGWLGSLWDKLDPDIKHLIKSMIPGYGAYMQFAEAEEYRERGDYFNAVRSATGALANVALTAAVIAALGIAAPAMMVVVLVTSAVVYCSDVATSCYNYGTKVSKGISELMETGGISPSTMEEIKEAEWEAKVSLTFGILGAASIDSCLAKMTTAKGVAGGAKGSLSNVEARKWYLQQEAKIPDLIDKNLSLEEQAQQAFNLRNQFRTEARELMSDRALAESLNITGPNKSWEEMIQRQIDKGFTGDDIYKGIIESSQRSRKAVNKLLGLE